MSDKNYNEVFTVRKEWLDMLATQSAGTKSEFYFYLLEYGIYNKEPIFNAPNLKQVVWDELRKNVDAYIHNEQPDDNEQADNNEQGATDAGNDGSADGIPPASDNQQDGAAENQQNNDGNTDGQSGE